MNSRLARSHNPAKLSLPTRGAWIEISVVICWMDTPMRRSPHGERGLKFPWGMAALDAGLSLPTRGAWIEISSRKCASSL